jgi:poly(3-hydroxybutyrate) depolymerase
VSTVSLLQVLLLLAGCPSSGSAGGDASLDTLPPDSGRDRAGDLPGGRDGPAERPGDLPLARDVLQTDAPPARDAPKPDAVPPSIFKLLGKTQDSCPWGLIKCAANWPPASEGTVSLYTSQETHGSATHQRTSHVYVPTELTTKVPLLIFLHGGTQDGYAWFDLTPVVPLADERGTSQGVTWQRNTPSCTFTFVSLLNMGFKDSAGHPCTPDTVGYKNGQRYVAVFPDGILDQGSTTARHWEDGRSPSPGWSVVPEQRDDLGFIDHSISTLLLEHAAIIDPERIYVVGGSNGGMMTQRLTCNLSSSFYPSLRKIAAVAPYVGTMPEPLKKGLDGRELCNTSGPVLMPMIFILGNKIDTPSCQPYGCTSPKVNGDGVVPYGATGGVYYVNSPDGGRVISAPDTLQHWVDYNTKSGAGGTQVTAVMVGQFTTVTRTDYSGSPARIELYEVEGGHHLVAGNRMDFNIWGRILDFVMRYRRNNAGTLAWSAFSPLSGDF